MNSNDKHGKNEERHSFTLKGEGINHGVEYEGLTAEEAHAMARAAISDEQVMLALPISTVFILAYTIQRYIHQTQTHDRLWDNAVDAFEYLSIVLVASDFNIADAFVHLGAMYESINEQQKKGE